MYQRLSLNSILGLMRAQHVQVMVRVTGHTFKCRYGCAPGGLETRCAQTVQAAFPALHPAALKCMANGAPDVSRHSRQAKTDHGLNAL